MHKAKQYIKICYKIILNEPISTILYRIQTLQSYKLQVLFLIKNVCDLCHEKIKSETKSIDSNLAIQKYES